MSDLPAPVAFADADPIRDDSGFQEQTQRSGCVGLGLLLATGSYILFEFALGLEQPYLAAALFLGGVLPGAAMAVTARSPAGLLEREAFAESFLPGRAWAEYGLHAGAPGWKIHQSFRVRGRAGRTLARELRVRLPGGDYLPAALSALRGPAGELRLRHVGEPLGSERVRISDWWQVLPRAALPEAYRDSTELFVELLIAEEDGGEVLSLRTLPLPPARLAAAPAPPPPKALPTAPEDARCPVCADPLGEDLLVCSTCETPHHRACWDYFGGCAAFACAAAPREVSRSPPLR